MNQVDHPLTMMSTAISLPTLEELSAFVKNTLCERDCLEAAVTPFYRTPLIRSGKPYGYMFHVEGPRLLKSSAIWVAEADVVTFYDSTGTKILETHLTDSPVLPDIRLAGSRSKGVKTKRKSA